MCLIESDDVQAERVGLHRQVAALQRALTSSQAVQCELADKLDAAIVEAAGGSHPHTLVHCCNVACVRGWPLSLHVNASADSQMMHFL